MLKEAAVDVRADPRRSARCASASAPRSRGALQSQLACAAGGPGASHARGHPVWSRAVVGCDSRAARRLRDERAWIVGRRVLRNRSTSPWVALLAGWGILRVLALIPVAGVLVGLAATVVGLRALAVALWRAGRPGDARGATTALGRHRFVQWCEVGGGGKYAAVEICVGRAADADHGGVAGAPRHAVCDRHQAAGAGRPGAVLPRLDHSQRAGLAEDAPSRAVQH